MASLTLQSRVRAPLRCKVRSNEARQQCAKGTVRAHARGSEGRDHPGGQAISTTIKALKGPAAAALVAGAMFCSPEISLARDNQLVGEFNASGLVFKDSVQLISFEDPKVEGVTLYISDFKRSLSAKLQKDFFSEPSQASIACVQTGPVVISDLASFKPEGEDVYKERKNLSLSNKTLRIRRLYDASNQSLVYVAYSTRLSGSVDDESVSAGRYKTSTCAVSIMPWPEAAPEVGGEQATDASSLPMPN